jgi:hypothetical protein
MSQSATLYPIDNNDFSAIKSNPNNLEILGDRENYVAFPGTHEGLRFVLSKGLNQEKADLVNEIFYPTTCIGEGSRDVFSSSEEMHEFEEVTEKELFDNMSPTDNYLLCFVG